MTPSLPDGWGLALDALRLRPAGLFTDIDGTLSPVAPTPDEARVAPEAREALGRLVGKVELVAAITGRDPRNAAGMVGLPGIAYIGNHGLEELTDGATQLAPEAEQYAGRIAPIFSEARSRVRTPGVIYEDKNVTGSVHYRQAPDPERARVELVAALAPLVEDAGLALHQGRMILEIRPATNLSKGTAACRLVERHNLKGCIFLGDDTTDTDAFRTLREMRSVHDLRAVCVGVLSPETPPAILQLSDFTVDGVQGVVGLLIWLEENL